MQASFLKPAFVCRPALALDRQAALELSSRIWEGEDYIAYVWDAWMADPVGLLAVAEYGGQLAGFGKLSRLSEQDWWLEGLRIHPELQGRGGGKHIFGYLYDRWREIGQGTIRFATSSENTAIHRMSASFGFQHVGEYSRYLAPCLSTVTDRDSLFTLLLSKDVESGFQLAQSKASLRLSPDLVDLGWQWAAPRPEFLARAAAAGLAWWWREREGLLSVWMESEGTETYPLLQFIACSPKKLVEFLLDFRLLAGQQGFAHAGWLVPAGNELSSSLAKAGFERIWDHPLYVFEKEYFSWNV